MAALDIYNSLNFRLNKKMFCAFGLWPNGSRRKFIRLFWILLLFVLSIPHMIAMIIDFSNMDKLMEHICVYSIFLAAFLKFVTLVIAENKMKSVYSDIANNWLMITDEAEGRILVEYAERGRIFTLAYMIMLLLCAGFFILLPLLPEIFNAIHPLPVPRPHIYVFNGEFLVENRDDYFYQIYLCETAGTLTIITISIAIDSMFTVSVEHGLALYAIVTHRLSKLRHRILSDRQDSTNSSYEWLVHTIKLHQVVLSFTSNINDSYSLCFFCLTIMNIVALPVTCVVMMIHWHDPMNFFRYALFLSGLMLHLFVLFWPGQKLINHSTRLLDDAYCNEWYETPLKTKKILRIFMLRCSKPFLLTAGGLIEMNFEIYLKVVKTAASYITVLASFR